MPDEYLLQRERFHWQQGCLNVCGIDEAGRGPLAGPVAAAAVVLYDGFDCSGINDSKKLNERLRQCAYERLVSDPKITYSIAVVDSIQIDRDNILKATHAAMRCALQKLTVKIDIVLVDGLPVSNLSDHPQEAIVKGDSISASIAAASILAKVTRDIIMVEFDQQWPMYGFAKHKGYGTGAHLNALAIHGPCPIHRTSFSPVRFASIKRQTTETFYES